MYSGMKKLKILVAVIFLGVLSANAQESSQVFLRFSSEDNNIRIVLESDEKQIRNANTIVTATNIQVEFPELFVLRKQNDFFFETFQTGNQLTIYIRDIRESKMFKLFEPARIVIDLETEYPPSEMPFAFPEIEYIVDSVVIDAGHGGYDFGIYSEEDREKDINLNLSKILSDSLVEKGKKIFVVRKADQAIPVIDRIYFVNQKKPDLFMSLHSSLSDKFVVYIGKMEDMDSEVTTELYRLSSRQKRHIEQSKIFAEKIGHSLNEEFNKEVVFRELPLPTLNSIDAPALMIEYPSVKLNKYDEQMILRISDAIIKGIVDDEE
jgi:N-acetylmuramoyl-L-alanine amidase